jgi:hypothetical protein
MIFYHFTFLKVVEGCRLFMRPGEPAEDGLIPYDPAPEGLTPEPGMAWGALGLQHKVPNAPAVVWLTTDPATVPAENITIWKCTIKIPSTDQKLINWPKWRARHLPYLVSPAVDKAWWGYAGTIPLDRIAAIEPLPDQKPPWHMD